MTEKVRADGDAAGTACWRETERARLLALRRALPAPERERAEEAVSAFLERALASMPELVLGAYQPIRAELDLRGLIERLWRLGVRVALPVVEAPARPLRYRAWTPDTTLAPGVWGIPIPPPDAETLLPTVLLAPPLGFDAARYRLGYGGGFFDRTLAALGALGARPFAIGVAHSSAMVGSVRPEPHDVPMDAIVSEKGWLGEDGWDGTTPALRRATAAGATDAPSRDGSGGAGTR